MGKPEPVPNLHKVEIKTVILKPTIMKTKNNKPQHTEGEWKYTRDAENSIKIFSTDSDYVAEIVWDETSDEKNLQKWNEAEGNAKHIVKAVNMYDDLVKELKMANEYLENRGITLASITALLKQAEQK